MLCLNFLNMSLSLSFADRYRHSTTTMNKSKSQQLSIFSMLRKPLSTLLPVSKIEIKGKEEAESTNETKKRKVTGTIDPESKQPKLKQAKVTAPTVPSTRKPRGPCKPRQPKLQSNSQVLEKDDKQSTAMAVDSGALPDASSSNSNNPTIKTKPPNVKGKPKPKPNSKTNGQMATKNSIPVTTKRRSKKTLDSDNTAIVEPGTFNIPLGFQPNQSSSDTFFTLSISTDSSAIAAAVPQATPTASAATLLQDLTAFQGQRAQITLSKTATLWTYKYAPLNLAELVGQGQAQVDLDRWIGERKTNPYFGYQCCTLSGASGSGTTTLARLALQRQGYKVVCINPTMLRQNFGCSTQTSSSTIDNGGAPVDSQSAMLDLVYNYASKLKNMQGESIALLLEQIDGELWSHCFPFATFEKLLVLHNQTFWEQRQAKTQVHLLEQRQLKYLQSINVADAAAANANPL